MASQEQSVEQLFEAALDQRPEDRRAFLDRACANAPELRRRVEELLRADEEAGSFLEVPFLTSLADHWDETIPFEEVNGARGITDDFKPAPVGRFDPGQIIADRFTVVRFIAHGGMGEVYEVEDRFLQGVHIALKVILPHIAGDAGSSRRFEQEVLLARKVTHPNLCPIYDISRCQEPAPPFVFLTMKLLAGETLASRLKRPASIPRGESISIFRQMVAGLAAIHDGGIVHRDIKPNNVMLDYSGSELCVSIMDFGLARLYDSQTTITVGLIAGTPGYIAPELLRGDPPSQATDIFALGVLFQQVLTNRCLSEEVHGLSVKLSPALDGADVPSIYIHSVKEFLSEDPERRCAAFRQIRSVFDSGGAITTRTPINSFNNSGRRILTRRNFIVGSTVAACATAGGIAWKWDGVKNTLDDVIHPLPLKRFVALLNWPPTSDTHIMPMLTGVIDAIGNELARAEAFDRNLFVIPPDVSADAKTTAQLKDIRESSGANLILAASGATHSNQFHLSLRVLDPKSTQSIREKRLSLPLDEQISFPSKAVRAATELLNVSHFEHNDQRTTPDTRSPEAYTAFQEAEMSKKQDNDKGLDSAIDKYKQAVELDPRYATAYAQLAWAYLRFYDVHGDSGALSLAHENAETALTLNPNLVVGHLALSSLLLQSGDDKGATREVSKALSLDPDNPNTLAYQGDFLATLNRWAEAESTFKRLLKTRPNNWLVHNELGALYNSEGKYPQAVIEFRAASLAAPKNAMSLNNLGSVFLQQGRVAEAKVALKRSLDLNDSEWAEKTMAASLRSEGAPADAIPFALKAVDLNPTESSNWLELGDCYSLARGYRGEATKAYTQAVNAEEQQLKDYPVDGPKWMILALCRVKAGAPQTVLALIEKAEHSLAPAGDLDSQLYKARTLELLGNREEALTTVAACLKRGATEFQFQTMPDMGALRDDPRYKVIVKSMSSRAESNV
jgi:eukaryotic-like serine/threonine-protein kinase